MENGEKSKCYIFRNILKNMIFQMRKDALLWSKGVIQHGNHLLVPAVISYHIT